MEYATIVLAAEEDELVSVGASNAPLDEWSGIEASGFDTLKFVALHCLLTGDSMQAALDLYEPAMVSEGETLVLRLTDEVIEQLALLDDESLENVAGELAASEEFEREDWDTDMVVDLLAEFSQLAQLAESQGQVLFVWMTPLQS